MRNLSFAHRTFQEYLAAKSAVSHFLLEFLINQSRDDKWRETIILACGEARPKERGEFLTSLIKLSKDARKDEKKRNTALLALACLETCTAIEPFEVRQHVIDYAKNFFPPQDLSEAQSIARAGDWAIDLLAYDSNLEPKIKSYCINSLSQIGTHSALESLTDYAFDLSPIVSKALVDARKYFNESEFIKKVLAKSKCLVFHGLENLSLISQIDSLTYLDIYDSKINKLTILEKHLDLEYLDIRQTSVSDLSPLSKLSNLEYLDIRETNVVNLKPLSKLRKLRKLFLDFKTKFDISPLNNNTKLEIIRRGTISRTSSEDNGW